MAVQGLSVVFISHKIAEVLGHSDRVTVMRNGNVESITQAVAECHRQAGARYIVSTTRNRALPFIMWAYPSAAFSNG